MVQVKKIMQIILKSVGYTNVKDLGGISEYCG